MKTIETYLPVFPGFYGTQFESDESGEIDDINCQRDYKGLSDINYEDCQWDYKEYNENVSKQSVNAIENKLQEILSDKVKIKYESLYSPREYNFENDSIYVTITMENEDYQKMIDILLENLIEFNEYVKENFTSRDGFISFVSNDGNDWINDFKKGKGDKLETTIAKALEFILTDIEEYDTNELFDDLTSMNCLYISATNYHELIDAKQ